MLFTKLLNAEIYLLDLSPEDLETAVMPGQIHSR